MVRLFPIEVMFPSADMVMLPPVILPSVIFWADAGVVIAVTAILNVTAIAIAVKNSFVFIVCLIFDTIYIISYENQYELGLRRN
jgi:hypothetical protein